MHNGTLCIGKTSNEIVCGNYGFEGKELRAGNFEVLVYPPGVKISNEEQTKNDPIDAPYKWILFNGIIPANAVGITNGFGNTIFVARAYIHDGLHPGYVDPNKMKCYTSYGGAQEICDSFEILIMPNDRYRWVPCINGQITGKPVIGGYEANNTNIYIAKCMYNDSIPCIGKTWENAQIANYGLLGTELKSDQFEILTYI